MRRWYAAAALGLALAVSAAADDPPKKADPPPKKDEPKTPAEQLKALKKEVSDASAAVNKAFGERKDEEDKEANKAIQKAFEAYGKAQTEAAAKALELARKDPKSEFAVEAVAWAIQGLRGNRDAMREAVGLLKEHHLESPKIASTVSMIRYAGLPDDVAADFLTAVAEKNPDRKTKAAALMGLGEVYKDRAARSGRSDPKAGAEATKKAEAMFERVAKEFGDVKRYGDDTFADSARGELFEMRNLAIGKVAPDIEGEDLDGAKFKLSDYRGKVIVLDFWGDW
jgi:hypothetical protein